MSKANLGKAALILGVTTMLAPIGGSAKDRPMASAARQAALHQVEIGAQAGAGKDQARTLRLAGCPPGLEKKDPACTPPGQAKKAARQGVVVGDVFDLNSIHIVTQPGLYGLGKPPASNSYAVIGGQLVRVDSDTGRLLSIIRMVDKILD